MQKKYSASTLKPFNGANQSLGHREDHLKEADMIQTNMLINVGAPFAAKQVS